MLQTIWFFLKISILIAGAIWLLSLPGHMDLSLANYNIHIKTGLFFIALIVALIVFIKTIQTITSIISLPHLFKQRKEKKNWQKAYSELIKSITAGTFGDGKAMARAARKAESLLPIKNSLPIFLEAQAAHIRNEDKQAQQKFEHLLKNKETMPLGLQGLLRTAIDKQEYKKALHFCEKLFKLYPKQPWVLQTYYQLLIKNSDYLSALNIGQKAVKYKAVSREQYTSDKIAIYYNLSEDKAGDLKKYLGKALSLDKSFTPTVIKLSQHYIQNNQPNKAASLIKAAWKTNPHPALGEIWKALAPSLEKTKKHQKWFESLSALNKEHFESYMLLADCYLENENKQQAIENSLKAWATYPSKRCLNMCQNIDPTFPSHSTLPDNVWICKDSGLIYDAWTPLAPPHDSFNTITWTTPTPANMMRRSEIRSTSTSFFLPAMQS